MPTQFVLDLNRATFKLRYFHKACSSFFYKLLCDDMTTLALAEAVAGLVILGDKYKKTQPSCKYFEPIYSQPFIYSKQID